MITMLLPDQVAKLWDYIKFAIEESAPPTVNNIDKLVQSALSSLLNGKAQCWLVYDGDSKVRRFEAVVITQIVHDSISGQKSLLIYCLYGYDTISEKSWKEGLTALIKWGSARGCDAIIGYTNNPVIIKKVKQIGGEVSTMVKVPFRSSK